MAFLKYAKNIPTKIFDYSDTSTYMPGWGTWGTTFRRDFNPRYVKVKAKSITYSPANFSGNVVYKGKFSVPYKSSDKYHYDVQNAKGIVKSIKAVINSEKLIIKKIAWDLQDIIPCEFPSNCRPRLEVLFSGDDVVKAGNSDIEIETYGGDDKIIGSQVPRDIDAGDGNDSILTHTSDILTGGDGEDIFAFSASANGAIIRDFEVGTDQIRLKGKGFDSVEVKSEYSRVNYRLETLLSWGDESVVRLIGVEASYEDIFG